jgi:hypothetical protein
MLIGIISALLTAAAYLLALIAQVLVVIVLAIVDFVLACLYVVLRTLLQWTLAIVLRVATVALWLASLYAAFGAIFALYSRFGDTLPTVVVSIALSSLVVIAPVVLILERREQTCGSLVFGLLIGGSEWLIASSLVERTELYPIVSVAPTVMAAAGMLYLAVVAKQKKRRFSNERDRQSV